MQCTKPLSLCPSEAPRSDPSRRTTLFPPEPSRVFCLPWSVKRKWKYITRSKLHSRGRPEWGFGTIPFTFNGPAPRTRHPPPLIRCLRTRTPSRHSKPHKSATNQPNRKLKTPGGWSVLLRHLKPSWTRFVCVSGSLYSRFCISGESHREISIPRISYAMPSPRNYYAQLVLVV